MLKQTKLVRNPIPASDTCRVEFVFVAVILDEEIIDVLDLQVWRNIELELGLGIRCP